MIDARFHPAPDVAGTVVAPWSEDQVSSLNDYQRCGLFHEFTGAAGQTLLATSEGWVCRVGGPVVQNWAWAWMADWSWQHVMHSMTQKLLLVAKRGTMAPGEGACAECLEFDGLHRPHCSKGKPMRPTREQVDAALDARIAELVKAARALCESEDIMAWDCPHAPALFVALAEALKPFEQP